MGAGEADTAPMGSGVAANGLVEATASPGPVLALTLDPRAKRLDPVELARQVTFAFNHALESLRSSLVTDEEEIPNLASLMTHLQDVQNAVVRSLSAIGEGINSAMAAAGERARLDVSATVEPTSGLFDRTREVLAVAQGAGAADPDLRGKGTALDEQVRVIAAGGGIETVEIDQRAMRRPAEDLAVALATAATSALRDLQANTRMAAPVDHAALREQTREIRDLSTQNMQSYAQAITDLMDRLDGSGVDR